MNVYYQSPGSKTPRINILHCNYPYTDKKINAADFPRDSWETSSHALVPWDFKKGKYDFYCVLMLRKERGENNFSKHLELVGNGLCNFPCAALPAQCKSCLLAKFVSLKSSPRGAQGGIPDAMTPPSGGQGFLPGLDVITNMNYRTWMWNWVWLKTSLQWMGWTAFQMY